LLSLVSVLSGSTRQDPPLAIVGITPAYSIPNLAGKSVPEIKAYFSSLRKENFPFLNPVGQKFVCTPMDSGVDPLGFPSASASIKRVDEAYVDFLVRLNSVAAACAPRGFVCVFFLRLLAPCLSVFVYVCVCLAPLWSLCLSACVEICRAHAFFFFLSTHGCCGEVFAGAGKKC